MKLSRKHIVAIIGTLAVAGILILFARRSSSPGSVRLEWSLTGWGVRRGEFQRSANGTLLAQGRFFQFGPLTILSLAAPEQQFIPIGTNALFLGTVLYDPATTQEWAKVIELEREYEFDDGRDRPGVLVETKHGSDWIPRENINKALIEVNHE